MGIKTNLKTFVLSSILPPLTAMQTKLNSTIEFIVKRTEVQNVSIESIQTNVAANHASIASVMQMIIELQQTVGQMKETQYTQEQLDSLIQRERELNWICSQLYEIVNDLKTTGSTNRHMPDFNKPIVTRAELEVEFRVRYKIPKDDPLTEEQLELFEHFIVQWFLDNPGHVLDEDLPEGT